MNETPESQQLEVHRLLQAPISITEEAFLELVIRQTVKNGNKPNANPPCHALISTFKSLKHYYGIDSETENHCFQALLLFSADTTVPYSIRIRRLRKYLKVSGKSYGHSEHQIHVSASVALDDSRLTVTRPPFGLSNASSSKRKNSSKRDTSEALSYLKKSPLSTKLDNTLFSTPQSAQKHSHSHNQSLNSDDIRLTMSALDESARSSHTLVMDTPALTPSLSFQSPLFFPPQRLRELFRRRLGQWLDGDLTHHVFIQISTLDPRHARH